MTRTLSVEEEIRRPAGEVWEALTDWENAHKWMPGVEGMSAGGETAEGTKLTFRARGAERSSEIVHCDAGKSIVLRSVQGGVIGRLQVRSTRPGRPLDPRHVGRRLPGHGAIGAHPVPHPADRHPYFRRQAAEAAEGDDGG